MGFFSSFESGFKLKLFLVAFFMTSSCFGSASEDMFSSFFKAVGGKSNLEKLKTLVREGEMRFPEHAPKPPQGIAKYQTEIMYPTKARVRIIAPNYIYDELKDDNKYYIFQDGAYRELADPVGMKQLDETASKANREMLYWQAEHEKVTLLSSPPSWAKNAKCLSGTKAQKVETVCFDSKTHLLAAVGSNEEYRIYQDWKKADDLFFPMHISHFRKGALSYDIHLSSVKVNELISADVFDRPLNKK